MFKKKMENQTPSTEVRLVVAQCFRTLKTPAENKDIITTFQTLHSYLDEGPDSRIISTERAEFRRAHFTRTARFLVSHIQADWMHSLKAETRKELWDGFFLKGPPEQTLLVLMEAIGDLRSVVSDKRQVHNIFVSLLFIIVPLFSIAGPAYIWTTWSASQRGFLRKVDLLNCCGLTVWRQDPLIPLSSERYCRVGLWDFQTC